MTAGPDLSEQVPLDRFRVWAARDPDRVALSDSGTQITFGELLGQVEAVSQAARATMAAAPPGAYLPVLVDRSARSAAAVVACLLGRVRFFPVDAAAPVELKRRLMARAGDPGCYLVGPLADPGIPGAHPVRLPGDPGPADVPTADDEGAALVVFSSGSTGEPKGIVLSWAMLDQRWRLRAAAADREAEVERREPLILPLDSAWAISAVADVSLGVTTHVVDVARMHPTRFLEEMAALAPTALTVPSQLGRLLAQLPERSVVPLPSVRRVHVGSEGFRYEYVRGLRPILDPDTVIFHGLASSEGGMVIANSFALRDCPPSGLVPLGHVVAADRLRLVPVDGASGGAAEVHVSGPIASEYLDDPELTAARFYTDPDGRRWWRSGDLVTTDDTGMYVHAGRMDDVVKVGGKLASPSEVTAVLMGIDGIRAAITVPVVSDGNTRLVAHVELEPETAVTLLDVRAALTDRLQPHAVPSAVLRHARLPVNVRGKVDRAVLMEGPFEAW